MNKELPEQFIKRLQQMYTPAEFAQVIRAMSHLPQTTFRANTLRIMADALQKQLEQEGFTMESIPWYTDAFVLTNKSLRELTETQSYAQGLLYIQNLSSMIPALVLDPKPDEMVLDLTAAPGSKTTQIATLMNNTGKIVANDISRPRLYKLHANLKMYGVTNTIVANIPGQTLWEKYPEQFDKTIVDAPCTMEGRIRPAEPKTYKDWSVKKIRDLAIRQQYLLRSAVSATKVGGTIVYSTCTLSPEENEGVINWLLKKEGDAIRIEPIEIPGLVMQQGITFWNKDFNPEVSKTRRIFPTESFEGFFVAKITKLKSTLNLKQLPDKYSNRRSRSTKKKHF